MHKIFWGKIRESVLGYSSKRTLPNDELAFGDKLGWLRYEKQIAFLDPILPKQSKILEIGCGWGHIAATLSVLRHNSKIIGVDLGKVPLWNDFQEYGCEFIIGNGLNLPFKDEAFDAVVSFGVIEHTTDDNKFLCEINRVLRGGGVNVIFNLPQRYALTEFFAKLFGLSHHDKKYEKDEIMNLLTQTHFRVDYIKKMDLVPAQVYKLSKHLNTMFNKGYLYLDRIDSILSKTPFCTFCGSFRIVSIKIGNKKVEMPHLEGEYESITPVKLGKGIRENKTMEN